MTFQYPAWLPEQRAWDILTLERQVCTSRWKKEKNHFGLFVSHSMMFTMRQSYADSNTSWINGIFVSPILNQYVNVNLPIETHPEPKSYKVEDEINQASQCDFWIFHLDATSCSTHTEVNQ